MRRCLITSLLIVAAAGCGSTEPFLLSLDAALDRTTVASSDSVRMTLTVTNISHRFVRGRSPQHYGFCSHAFRVFDSADREVAVPTGFCVLSGPANILWPPSTIELPPGGNVIIVDYWHPNGSTIGGAPISAGTYRLVGEYHAEGVTFHSPAVEVRFDR